MKKLGCLQDKRHTKFPTSDDLAINYPGAIQALKQERDQCRSECERLVRVSWQQQASIGQLNPARCVYVSLPSPLMNTRNALLVLDYLVLLVLLYSSMVVLVVVVVVLWDILASVWFLLFALNRLSEAPDLLEHVRN